MTFDASSGPRDLSEWIRSEFLLQIGVLRPQIGQFWSILAYIWCPSWSQTEQTEIQGPCMVGLVVKYPDPETVHGWPSGQVPGLCHPGCQVLLLVQGRKTFFISQQYTFSGF